MKGQNDRDGRAAERTEVFARTKPGHPQREQSQNGGDRAQQTEIFDDGQMRKPTQDAASKPQIY
jgi:hypothetical protein